MKYEIIPARGYAMRQAPGAFGALATVGGGGGGSYQPLDATLTGFAEIATGADQLAYSTGADAFAQTPFTSFGRSVVGCADAAALSSLLGGGGGGSYQPLNGNLTALAGLSLVGDRLPYANTTNSLALTPFTAFARTLIDDADAATMRTTLGLGGAATQSTGTSGGVVPLLNGANTWSAAQTFGATPLIANTNPMLRFQDTNASADEGQWRWNVNGQFMELQTGTDAGVWDTALFFQRTAGVVIGIQFNKAAQFNGSFTATSTINLASATPIIACYESDQGTDLKRWRHTINGGTYSLQIGNDADSAYTSVYTVGRATNVSATVTFPATTSIAIAGPLSVTDTLNTQTGTTYTVQASDAGKVVELNNAAAIAVTVPNSLPAGFNCILSQIGAGQVTVAAGSGATVHAFGGLKSPGQWAELALRVRANAGGAAAEAVLSGGVA